MKKVYSKISGGAKVHRKLLRSNISRLVAIPIVLLLLHVSSAFAQGSIYGTVTNSDLSVPANGDIIFYGFLDNTDEEMRIETSIGAGYDAGNWFDDFQNYLTEAPGNPYDYYFYNLANGENAVLSDIIPNNSFQQEDIILALDAAWPGQPTGLTAVAISSSSAIITWDYVSGMTYHIYRRLATSGGSFFRIDAPTGSLANHGVAVGYFVDNNIVGTNQYHYLIIAEDASGNLGPHSDVYNFDPSVLSSPSLVSVLPTSGTYIGGTSVTIAGNNFDMNGVTVDFSGNLLTSVTVVSPYQITGITPAGTVGPVDITVTNTASLLSSNILAGGFTYLGNQNPVLTAIGNQATTEGVNLHFTVTATDPDGTTPTLSAAPLPGAATFVDNGDGTATFDWTPLFTEAGQYQVTFEATDGISPVTELVTIDVAEAGNQFPILDPITTPQTVAENANLIINVTASDPDGTIPTLSATDVPINATFTDNLDGTGVFDFTPDFDQAGSYDVVFKAFDGVEVDSGIVTINVTETNRPPVLAAIGAQAGDEGVLLSFIVSATDADGTVPTLTADPLPGTANFVDNGDGTGLFEWTPSFDAAGPYQVTFSASDGTDAATELVDITINDAGNQPPVLDPIGPQVVVEGQQLLLTITASDPDGTVPTFTAETVPTNATFVDNGDGTATFTFDPDFSQSGSYMVNFIASDGLLTDEELVEITVTEVGNQAPIISDSPDAIINEGDSLIVVVTAIDPDGSGVILSASTNISPALFTFVDSGNGVAVFSYGSSYMDAGQKTVTFFATDFGGPPASATDQMLITVNEVNQPPVFEPAGPYGVAVSDALTFTITASDTTDPISSHRLFLTATGLPSHATFTDNGDNTGTFNFNPDVSQVGPLTVIFIATDMGSPQLSAQMPVNINVVTVNIPPAWVDPPATLTVYEGEVVQFTATATDPDGGFPVLYADKIPENATFTDFGDGTGLFRFTPSFVQSGLYQLVLVAYDGIDATRTNPILIQVYEAGNQSPVFSSAPDGTVTEGESVTINLTAIDPDGTIPSLSASGLPENATFTDNGDGTATIVFDPNYVQAGTYNIDITASDGEFDATTQITIEVVEAGNQTPVMNDPGNQSTTEMRALSFNVSASDADLDIPILTASLLPGTATFTDHLDGTGTFSWTPDVTSAGNYDVEFVATDALDPALFDTKTITISVADTNLTPYPYIPSQNRTVYEGDTLYYRILGMDDDGGIPSIVVNSPTYELQPNMVWVDSGNGVGLLTFTPDYTQGAPNPGRIYFLQWLVVDDIDPSLTNPTNPVTQFTVLNRNQPPVLFTAVTELTLTEGQSVNFSVVTSDPDGQSTTLWVENPPDSNYTFTGTDRLKSFVFNPDYTQAGTYLVDFVASDGVDESRLTVTINVLEAGNQSPYFTSTYPTSQAVVSGEVHTTSLAAIDPEGGAITITHNSLPLNSSFTDFGDGTAQFVFTPATDQIGRTYSLIFTATDPELAIRSVTIAYNVVEFLRGDANSDNSLDMSDILFILNYLYKDGPAPASEDATDVNFDNTVNILDAEFLVRYFYKQGPPPQ